MSRVSLALCIAFVTACGGTATTTSPTQAAPPANQAPRVAPLAPIDIPAAFRSIPASTPYLMAMDLNTPWMKSRIGLIGFAFQEIYRDLRNKPLPPNARDARLVKGLLDLIGDELTTASLARLGIPALPRAYLYGIGIMPALRLPLTSGAKLRDTIDRVRALVGPAFPAPRALSGIEYWYFPKLSKATNQAGPKADLSLAFAIVGNELVAGIIVESLKDDMLPILLGIKPPELSLAASPRLEQTLRRYHIQANQLAFFDLVRVTRQFFGGSQDLPDRIMSAARGKNASGLSAECRDELTTVASLMPRVIGGSQSSSKTRATGKIVVELHDDVIHALKSSRGEIPVDALRASTAPIVFGLGLDPEQLGVQLVSAARRVRQKPFRCPELSDLNQAAASIANVPVEALLRQVGSPMGVAGVFTKYQQQPARFEGAMVVAARDPAALWRTVQAQLPGFQRMNPSVGGAPVRGAIAPSGPFSEVYAARTESRLGVSVGGGAAALLGQVMAAATATDGALAVMYYDESLQEADDYRTMLVGIRAFGLHKAAQRIEARLTANHNPSRAGFTMRIGKHGLIADYEYWKVKR